MSLFWSVGSSKLSDIIFGGKYIAEHHALLIRDRDRIFIEDLGSTFGTYVNGDAIKGKTELFAGDRVKLGPSCFTGMIMCTKRQQKNRLPST